MTLCDWILHFLFYKTLLNLPNGENLNDWNSFLYFACFYFTVTWFWHIEILFFFFFKCRLLNIPNLHASYLLWCLQIHRFLFILLYTFQNCQKANFIHWIKNLIKTNVFVIYAPTNCCMTALYLLNLANILQILHFATKW